MAYARFGDNSDVYVYSTGADLICQRCCLGPEFSFYAETTAAMIAHLEAHQAAGHKVPDDTIPRLIEDQVETDAEFAAIDRKSLLEYRERMRRWNDENRGKTPPYDTPPPSMSSPS